MRDIHFARFMEEVDNTEARLGDTQNEPVLLSRPGNPGGDSNMVDLERSPEPASAAVAFPIQPDIRVPAAEETAAGIRDQLIGGSLAEDVPPRSASAPMTERPAPFAGEIRGPKSVPEVITISSGSESGSDKEGSKERGTSPEVIYCGPGTSNAARKKKCELGKEIDLREIINGINRAKKAAPSGVQLDSGSSVSGEVPDAVDCETAQATVSKEEPVPKRARQKNNAQQAFPVAVDQEYTALSSPPPVPVEPTLRDQIVPITNAACFVILTERAVTIAGITRVACYAGTAEISGYSLQPGSGQFVVPSLHNESWLTIHGRGELVDPVEFQAKALAFFDKEYVQPCLDAILRFPEPVRAVVVLTSSNALTDPVLWNCVDLFPSLLPDIVDQQMRRPERKDVLFTEDERETTWDTVFPGCYLMSYDCRIEGPRLDYNMPFWRLIREELVLIENSPVAFPIVLLCGSKNVGKSTTVRFLLNHFLGRYPSVQCLDCDIGQSEFNPPGCLSMHTFDSPVFGPPFARLHQPDACCYLGEVTPSNIVSYYENALRFVFQTGRKDKMPLIVNTMGWVERLGLHLLQQAANLAKPDLILELKRPEENGVAPSLTRSQISRMVAVKPAVPYIDTKKAFPPFFRRKLAQIAYLSQISPSVGPINNAVPYTIGFSDVALYFVDETIPSTHFLTVLIGAYVGLSSWSFAGTIASINGLNVVKNVPVGACMGFGIIRGIDVEAKLFYVLTPIAEDDLSRVNLIIRGSISTPEEVFLNQDIEKWEGHVPRLQYRYAFEE